MLDLLNEELELRPEELKDRTVRRNGVSRSWCVGGGGGRGVGNQKKKKRK